MRILFVSGNRVGDAVITCGVLDYLIRGFPDCRITIVCGPVAAGVFARMPNRERTILFEKRPFDLHWLMLWWKVALTRWDLVVDMRRSALGWLVPARRRAMRRQLPVRMFEQYAAALDLDPAPLPVVWTAPQDRALAARLLPTGSPIVGFGPTANWPGKIWPTERFAALFGALADGPLPGARAAIFAGPGENERRMAAPLLAGLPDAINLCGKLSLPEVAACLQRCALYVGNDSGLMHLAAAAGTPTLGLCGSTLDRAVEMAPAGPIAAWALSREPNMEALEVTDVLDAAIGLLDQAAEGVPPHQPTQVTGPGVLTKSPEETAPGRDRERGYQDANRSHR